MNLALDVSTGSMLLPLATFIFVSSITPGPNNVMLTASGANFGYQRSMPHMLGITVGCSLMLFLVGAGLGALFEQLPQLYTVLQYLGAAYLVWLAAGMLRAAWADPARAPAAAVSPGAAGEAPPLGRTFRQGLLTNVLNPKVALFFLAFLPQFIDAATPDKAFSFLVLGAWFAAQSALFLAVLVGITGLLRQRARSSIFGSASAGRWLQGLGGLLFLGLAARLARTEAPVP